MPTNLQKMERLARQVDRIAQRGHEEYAVVLTEGLTTGRGASPGVPVFSGEAIGSLRVGVGAEPSAAGYKPTPWKVLTKGAVRAASRAAWKAGTEIVFRYLAPHVRFLVGGRRRGPSGRMLGSKQAPGGWIPQAEDEADARMITWRYQEGLA